MASTGIRKISRFRRRFSPFFVQLNILVGQIHLGSLLEMSAVDGLPNVEGGTTFFDHLEAQILGLFLSQLLLRNGSIDAHGDQSGVQN